MKFIKYIPNGNFFYLLIYKYKNRIFSDKIVIDRDLCNLNNYTTYAALELLKHDKHQKRKEKDGFEKLFGNQAKRKRLLREYVWNPLMPPLFRPFIYFTHRYFFRLGFLDRKEGFIFHLLHGLWFYFLIDVKYIEMKRKKCVE